MNCQTSTIEILGHKYTYTQLPATKSLLLKYKLAAIIGSSITDLIPALGKKDEEQVKYIGNAIQDLFNRNKPDEIVALLKDIFTPAFRDGERVDFDEHYTGNFKEMYEALAWILRTEYGNFLSGVENLLP